MRNVIDKIITLLEKRERFALAAVVEVHGSAPRDAGAHMIICHDGKTFGTIGGGALEKYVCDQSPDIFKNRDKQLLTVGLEGKENSPIDMTCGGRVGVFIQYIDPDRGVYLDVCRAIRDNLVQGRRAWLVTGMETGSDQLGLITDQGDFAGNIDIDHNMLFQRIKSITSPVLLNDLPLLVEPVSDAGTAYIFGAGHIAGHLLPLLNMVGFKTVVIDDRSEYANADRFGTADRIIAAGISEAFERIELDNQSYIVIITRGHVYDKEVLGAALKKPAAYIGMISSRRKRELIYNALLGEGYTQHDLHRVYSPIGLKIQAESPEEIAVSITAEMIQVRASLRSSGKVSSRCPEK